MSVAQTLLPAQELAATNTDHFPNESVVYRTARNAVLVEEIELRRHVEHLASQRRALPDGGKVPNDFEVVSETGPIASPACSAIKTHRWFTARCTVQSAKRRVRLSDISVKSRGTRTVQPQPVL